MKYKANYWVKLELETEIEADSYEEAEQKLIEIYRTTPYADMEYVDGDYTIEEAAIGYRVYYTFRNELGEDVRTFLDNNSEGFTPDDALDVAKELQMQGRKDVKITRLGSVDDGKESAECTR